VFLGPYLRKFGPVHHSRLSSAPGTAPCCRSIGILRIIASFTYLIAQVTGVGIIMSGSEPRLLRSACSWPRGILVCSMLGGMKAVTWTQVASTSS